MEEWMRQLAALTDDARRETARALLAELTGEPPWREAAGRQLRFLAGQAEKYPEGHCFAMLAMEKALSPHRQMLAAA